MTAIITGDIINSREVPAGEWMPLLKEILSGYGKSPKNWEIYRGDSFQLQLSPKLALQAAFSLKAGIKQVKELDVRLAIGIGNQDHEAKSISESNGSAFVRSGECFENLKKQNLGIITGNLETDETLNLMFQLALLTMNNWSPTVAETIKVFLQHPGKNQTELARELKKSQSSISEALKRGGFDEIMQLENFYRRQISNL